jgi:Mannosyl-glycoprotein endo-beta-N-acetylglucosaminidase
MFRVARRILVAPLLVLCASGAVVTLDAGVAQAATTATVKVSGGTLKIRSGPATSWTIIGSLKNKAKVTIACQVAGQWIKGSVRSTTQWDQLSGGGYISHGYVVTKSAIPVCAPPPAVIPTGPLSTASKSAFIASAVPAAQQSQREYRVPTSVTLAQAILESGWGRSTLSQNDRNYFGMKCFGSPGPIAIACHTYSTNECDATHCFTTTASFRVYATTNDSFRDHGRLLATNSRYRAAFAYTHNPNQFAAEIHKAGYATDPQYTTKLVGLMTQYNLYQYDLK